MDELQNAEVADFYLALIRRVWTDLIDWRVRTLRILANLKQGEVLSYSRIAKKVGAPIQSIGKILKELEEAYPHRFNTHRVVQEGGWCSENYPGGSAEHAARLRTDRVGTNRIPRKDGSFRLQLVDFYGHLHHGEAA